MNENCLRLYSDDSSYSLELVSLLESQGYKVQKIFSGTSIPFLMHENGTILGLSRMEIMLKFMK